MARYAARRGDKCIVVVTVASARSSTSSEPARFSGGALDVGVTGSARLALVLDVAGTPRPAFVLEIAVLSALTLALTIAVFTRDCYTWHLQRCISLDYISNCFLIVMRPIERARRDPRGLFKRTAARATGSAPWQTTANSARPSSTRSVHVSGPVISTTHSAHSHAALTTEHNASLLPGRPSAGAPRAVRRHLGRRRRRCVNVAVDLPKHRGAPRPQTSQCRFRALRAA